MSVTLSHTARLEADLQRRAQVASPPGAASVRFSILTTVYERTDAALFAETAACLRGQTLPLHEWVVLAHGPVPAALDRLLDEYAGDPSFRLMRLPTNLGIMGGMRVCLEAASGDYIVPMDADDLLTVDALQVRTGWSAAELAVRLLELEFTGQVARMPGGLYQRLHTG
jgi:glycosyltransferase involved in cell wall biosynthesis